MIASSDIFRQVREVDPGFEPAWAELVEEWGGEAEVLLYPALTRLALHLIGRLEAGETSRFAAVFGLVERWVADRDSAMREAVVVGLLEDLQNGNLYASGSPAAFQAWLGPASAHAWAELDAYWAGGPLGRLEPG